jgi:hypothetical protein
VTHNHLVAGSIPAGPTNLFSLIHIMPQLPENYNERDLYTFLD